ncbi:hypothetical protein [Streptomyces chryseus]
MDRDKAKAGVKKVKFAVTTAILTGSAIAVAVMAGPGATLISAGRNLNHNELLGI